jgi:DNA-directed RNA polymerase subunit RPC12/RpoP
MANNKLTMEIDVESKKMVLKLKAIAKHTSALAEELEQIDGVECPNCGGQELAIADFHCDGMGKTTTYQCSECNYDWIIKEGEDA